MARACCAPHLVPPSRCSSKTPKSSRSCSIPTAGSGSIGSRVGLSIPANGCRPPTASASCASSHTMSVPRCTRVRRGFRPSCQRPASGLRVCSRRWLPRRLSRSANPLSRCLPSTTTSPLASCGRPGARHPACGRRCSPQYSGRRRHLDRQDHTHQRAAGGNRRDHRSRRTDRGHPRTAMPGAEPCCAAYQGRRRLAFRLSFALRCACGPIASRSARCAARRRSTS